MPIASAALRTVGSRRIALLQQRHEPHVGKHFERIVCWTVVVPKRHRERPPRRISAMAAA